MPTSQERQALIDKIRVFPAKLEARLKGLSTQQLTTPYLENEWTVAQNVHHLADSHMNAYMRTRLILTEDYPPLKGYDQDVWAKTPDAMKADVSSSLSILHGLHSRWTTFFESLDEDDWSRTGNHSERGAITLEWILEYYADHGEGHIDQINRTLAAGQ